MSYTNSSFLKLFHKTHNMTLELQKVCGVQKESTVASSSPCEQAFPFLSDVILGTRGLTVHWPVVCHCSCVVLPLEARSAH